MTPAAILTRLRALGSEENLAGMARYGIVVRHAYGVPLSVLRGIAKELGRDQARALELWNTGNREARVLAILTADPNRLTRTEANRWVRSIESWDLCDGFVNDLLRKTPFAWEMAWKWSRQKPEFVRRAGFSLLACLAVHDKRAKDEEFCELLPLIEEASTDERNFVKKAVNWALRQIGKRNAALRSQALESARRLASSDARSARWVGKDAVRELERYQIHEDASKSRRKDLTRKSSTKKKGAPR